MATSKQVKLRVEEYFGDEWVWHVLRAGQNWGIIPGVNERMDIFINNKEIRIYPVQTNRELAIRLAVWDYSTDKNRDDMYVRTEEDLLMIPILLDKFFG
jgi:hypothetical protein